MKKVFGFLLAMMMLVSPFTVKAVTADDEEINIKKYNTSNYKEILAEEKIKEEFKNYAETDDQITIYLFRGHECGFCQRFLNFLNSITDEYGKYFKVVGFEVWSDAKNSELLGQVSDFLGEDAGGVPYIIIGDQVFPGYADTYNDGIKSAIKTLYESENRYDVFEEYNKAVKEAKWEEFRKTLVPAILNALFVTIGVVVVCSFVRKENKVLLEKITENKYATKVVKEETANTEKVHTEKVAKKNTTNKKRK